MSNPSEIPVETLLSQLAGVRAHCDEIEASWKEHRAESKRLTLELVIHHGYSILRASNVSGHQRGTIMAWLAAAGYRDKR